MTYHIGAFIRETVRPLINELEVLMKKLKKMGVKSDQIEVMVDYVVQLEIIKTISYCITYVIIGVFFCLTLYFILR